METKNPVKQAVNSELGLLVRSKDGKLFKCVTPPPTCTIVALCVGSCGWFMVKIPALTCTPDVLLETVKHLTGLPVRYPTKEDYALVNQELPEIKSLMEKIHCYDVRIDDFCADEFEQQEDFVSSGHAMALTSIRFLLDLDDVL